MKRPDRFVVGKTLEDAASWCAVSDSGWRNLPLTIAQAKNILKELPKYKIYELVEVKDENTHSVWDQWSV